MRYNFTWAPRLRALLPLLTLLSVASLALASPALATPATPQTTQTQTTQTQTQTPQPQPAAQPAFTPVTCPYAQSARLTTSERLALQVKAVRERTPLVPKVALVLGSGLGSIADAVTDPVVIPFGDIPGFPVSTVEGHDGKLVLGHIEGCPVAVLRGRVHYYEGYTMEQVIMPVRLMHALGAETVIFSNSSGAINTVMQVGDIMMLTDHINLMGVNPLIGPNDDKLGPRFFPTAGCYTPELQLLARDVAAKNKVRLAEGVYCGLTGPSYETPAEFNMLRILGADAVGMSTVPEVLAAAHCGMKIAAFSCVTDVPHYGPGPVSQTNHEAVLAAANKACSDLELLIRGMLKTLR